MTRRSRSPAALPSLSARRRPALGSCSQSRYLEMLRPQRLLLDRQRPLVERLGLLVPALGLIEHGEAVETLGHVRMVRAEGQKIAGRWRGGGTCTAR